MIQYRNTALTNTDVQVAVAPAYGLKLTGFNVINTANTADTYLKFYDALSANVTVGTTTPVMVLHIPGGGSIVELARANAEHYIFTTAMTIAAVTTLADSGSTAPTTAIYVELYYSN